MDRQEAKIKLLARSLAVLFLAFLTTAVSCGDVPRPEAIDRLLTLEREEGQTKTRASEQTKEALLALLPVSPSSGQVTTIPLPTHTATPTPTSPNTPTPTSTFTRTSTPTSTPTLPPTATHTPTPTSTPTLATTIFYKDPLGDCHKYTSGGNTSCEGGDITELEGSFIDDRLTLDISVAGEEPTMLVLRYTTPLGTRVPGVAAYPPPFDYANWFAWYLYWNQYECKPERSPANSTCQVIGNKKVRITVPEPGFGSQPSGAFYFLVIMGNFANRDPNLAIDSAPNPPAYSFMDSIAKKLGMKYGF